MRIPAAKYLFLALSLCVALSSLAKKKQAIAPSYSWSISDPLGLRYPAAIDTAYENYGLRFISSLRSKAWSTTGNYGAQGQDMIFFNRPATSDFFFEDGLATWLPSVATQRFFNTRIPMTVLGHATGGNKYSNQDRTQVLFSGNVDKRIEVGGAVDYIYSKGSYDYQAAKNFRWSAFGSYIGDRYEMQAFINSYSSSNKESGGITNDLYIIDPAQVQGGESKVDPKDIPTRLTEAQNNLNGTEFYMNHRYKVGFYRYERDSVTDTIKGKTYVPVTSFIWTLDYKHNKHKFINASATQDTAYFDHTYLGYGGTRENQLYTKLRNTVGISMLEGFNKYAKFGFAVYATHELRRYTQVTDSVTGRVAAWPTADSLTVACPHKHTESDFTIGGQLTKQHGSILTYGATAEFGIAGPHVGDIDVTGDVATRFRLLKDTVTIKGYGYFKNKKAPYLLEHFVSNHFAWDNNFDKITRLRLGGVLDVPFSGSNVDVGYETLKNYVYFGSDGTPAQCGSPIHVLNATLKQNFAFKALHWENDLTFQTSSNSQVLPLPKFSVYSNVYVKFTIARVLHCQLGVDGNYYTRYYAPAYNPATMTFHNQNEVKCGNFAFMNAYANFRMKQARFFVMYSHVNKGIFGGNNYFNTPHYPLNPGRFQLGVIVDFIN